MRAVSSSGFGFVLVVETLFEASAKFPGRLAYGTGQFGELLGAEEKHQYDHDDDLACADQPEDGGGA